jgi:hypothetical protein
MVFSIDQITATFPEGKCRGSGAFGTVYGPFKKYAMDAYITWLFPEARLPALKNNEEYVFKLVKTDTSLLGTSYSKMFTLRQAIMNLDENMRKHFVDILFLGPVKDGTIEIQRHGGIPLRDALTVNRIPIAQVHQSFMAILGGLYRLCYHHNLLVTDIKPANMVYHPHYGICLIDLEYVDLKDTKGPLVYTNLYDLLPIQFFLLPYFSQPPRLEKYKASAGKREVVPFTYRKKIGEFSLAWVIVHIYFEVVRVFFATSSFQNTLKEILDEMTEKRWTVTVPQVLRKMRKMNTKKK